MSILLFCISCTPSANATISQITEVPTTAPPPSFIKTQGKDFAIAGEPFRFIGANSIYFGFYREYGFDIEDAIRSAKQNGIDVLRIYLGFGNSTWGQKSIEEYDKALDIASKYDLRIIAVLTDCCCFSGRGWSETEEKYYSTVPYCNFTQPTAKVDFKKYIDSIILRKNSVNGKIYRDDPTIMAWDIVNEPSMQFASTAEFKSWLTDISSYIRSIDGNHLITIGIDNSSKSYDEPGAQYEALDMPGLDFFSIHFNLPPKFDRTSQLQRLQFRVNTFLSMGKPVILEEFGIGSLRAYPPMSPEEITDWVKKYKDQMDVVFSAGGSGAMFWGWGVPETKTVPLWWQSEDHDMTETAFCDLIRDYQFPTPGSVSVPTPMTSEPDDSFNGVALDETKWQIYAEPGNSVTQDDQLIFVVSDQTPLSGAGII